MVQCAWLKLAWYDLKAEVNIMRRITAAGVLPWQLQQQQADQGWCNVSTAQAGLGSCNCQAGCEGCI